MLVLDGAAVRELLPMEQAIERMRVALARYSDGAVTQPLRAVLQPQGGPGLLGVMPAWAGDDLGGFGVKVVAIFPGNATRGIDTHIGTVTMYDPVTGVPSAVLDAAALTEVRTAAVSAAATGALANPGAGDLAILGSGVQARSHLRAMAAIRDLRRVRAWSRTGANAAAFAAWAGKHLGIGVEVTGTVAAALDGADLICTTLACAEPVVTGGMLAPGAHLNVIGASQPSARELTGDAVACATVFVDSRTSALAEAGDLVMPIRAGELGPEHIAAEVGEVLLGRHPGRTVPDEITLFKSVGMAVEDVVAAAHVEAAARARGLGTEVAL